MSDNVGNGAAILAVLGLSNAPALNGLLNAPPLIRSPNRVDAPVFDKVFEKQLARAMVMSTECNLMQKYRYFRQFKRGGLIYKEFLRRKTLLESLEKDTLNYSESVINNFCQQQQMIIDEVNKAKAALDDAEEKHNNAKIHLALLFN